MVNSDDVSQLEELLQQVRAVRALLPQVLGKLANVPDDSGCTPLFQDVAAAVAQWLAEADHLETRRAELEPLIAGLVNEE